MDAPNSVNDNASPEVQGGLDFERYLGMVLKHKLLVLFTTTAVFAVVAALTFRAQPMYRAEADVVIELEAPQVLGNAQEVLELGNTGYFGAKEYDGTQHQRIKSRRVAQKVVDKLGLDKDLSFLGLDKLPPERKAELPDLLANAKPVERLQGMIAVYPHKGSRIVGIEITDTDPKRAARLANAVARAYIESNLELKLDTTQGAIVWLSEQVDKLKAQVDAAEKTLYDFNQDNYARGTSVEDLESIVAQNITKLSESRARRITLEAQRRQVLAAEKAGDVRAALEEAMNSSVVGNLELQLSQLELEVAELEQSYGEKHPLLQAALRKRQRLQTSLDEQVGRARSQLEARYRAAVDVEKGLEQEIASLKTQATSLGRQSQRRNELEAEVASVRGIHDRHAKRLKDIQLQRMSKANNVSMFEDAKVPGSPFSPRTRMNLALGLLAGLIAGVMLSLLLELLDNTVKSQEDAETLLGVPAIGVVPRYASERRGSGKDYDPERDLHILYHPKSTEAECCRSIRTNLTFMSPDRPASCVLVTSPAPREGKTSTVINLGITFAQANLKTCILDTDLRRPRIHKSFAVPNDTGLSSVIAGQAKIEEAVKATEVENLDLLPCGPIPPNPSELLGTRRFEDVLEELQERYDRVILDSPPINIVADAAVISRLTDGVVLVMKTGGTSKPMLLQAYRALTNVNAKILGLLLNNVDVEAKSYRYRYRYGQYRYGGYGYAYGYTPAEEEAAAGSSSSSS